ncbi:MAG TPA: amidohydrolase family protein [Pirellulales bacterium]|jgi:cytosine/adenosine deaminase-related metal-dependent hydrolase|nr:amidohydrolase family protein [Pirellulales bacterium]
MPEVAEPLALRARWVFTAAGSVLPDGVVTIAGDTIVAVGENASGRPPGDLGNVALLPGLGNAHTHLDFSDLRAPLGKPGMPLPAWIQEVLAWRRAQPADPTAAIECGLRESLAAGVTALGEIATPGDWTAAIRLRQEVTVFHEVLAPTAERAAEALRVAREFAAGENLAWRRGLSPHAPHTLTVDAFQEVVQLAARFGLPVASHVAESREELEYLATGGGAYRELFEGLGITPSPCLPRPLDYLRLLAEVPRALVVHGNYLDDQEIDFLAQRRDRMTVVYCPRTHAYFGHERYPLEQMLATGCNVALGTDGRGSNPDLSLLEEMRHVARHYSSIAPERVLQMATVNGARALGMEQMLGTIEPGKQANLLAVALPDRAAHDPFEALFDCDLPVAATWYRGKELLSR